MTVIPEVEAGGLGMESLAYMRPCLKQYKKTSLKGNKNVRERTKD